MAIPQVGDRNWGPILNDHLQGVEGRVQDETAAAEVAAEVAAAAASTAAAALEAAEAIVLADASGAVTTALATVASNSVADGVADDRTALASADAAALLSGKEVLLRPGTHRVASALTITSPVRMLPGARIKPASGITVTLAGGVSATPHQQVFDHSDGGLVVPKKVEAYYPGWWGPVNTADDSTAWKAMLASRAASGDRQTIRVPAGTTRLWDVDLASVHVDASGHSRIIKPALAAAVADDPRSTDSGYMVKLGGTATVAGGEWNTDGVAGITAIFYTGTRAWIRDAYIRPIGVGSTGVWAYAASGSITPRMSNCVVYSGDGGGLGAGHPAGLTGTGRGVVLNSPDAELDQVWVGFVDTGIIAASGSATLTGVHVWGCTGVGVVLADGCVVQGGYIETNGSWGIDARAADRCRITGTRFWKNGYLDSTGGLRFSGDGVYCEANQVSACLFDDNLGVGILIEDADYLDIDAFFTSTNIIVSGGGSPGLGTTGVRVLGFSRDINLRLRERAGALVGALVDDQGTTNETSVDLGRRRKTTNAPVALGPNSTSLTSILNLPIRAGHKYRLTGNMIVDGPQAADLRVRVEATGSTGASGWFGVPGGALAASATSTTAASSNPASAVAVTASAPAGITVGLVGVGTRQFLHFEGYVVAGTADGTLNLHAGPQVSDPAAVTVSYADLELVRV